MPSLHSFIYLLEDPNVPNKGYVGKSNNPENRLKGHLKGAILGKTRIYRWLNSLLKDGYLPKLKILELADDWKEGECRWIKLLKEDGWDLMNHTSGGDGVHDIDEETRNRMRVAAQQRAKDIWENEEIAIMIKHQWKISGRNQAISEATTKYRENNPKHHEKLPQNNVGFKHTEEFKRNVGESTRKNNLKRAANGEYGPLSEDHKRKIGDAHRGSTHKSSPCSEERKRHLSEKMKGVPKSEECKQRMSEAAKKRWEKFRQSKMTVKES